MNSDDNEVFGEEEIYDDVYGEETEINPISEREYLEDVIEKAQCRLAELTEAEMENTDGGRIYDLRYKTVSTYSWKVIVIFTERVENCRIGSKSSKYIGWCRYGNKAIEFYLKKRVKGKFDAYVDTIVNQRNGHAYNITLNFR